MSTDALVNPIRGQFDRTPLEWDPFEVTPEQRASREAAVQDLSQFGHVYHHVLFGNDEVDDYDRKSASTEMLSAEELAVLRRARTREKPEGLDFDAWLSQRCLECSAELNALPERTKQWTPELVEASWLAVAASIRREVKLHQANAISSRLAGQGEDAGADAVHTVMLDIDHPVRVVESTTPGHYHLYIDVPVAWGSYEPLLRALAEAGVIEEGYYRAAARREATHLRLPWVSKEPTVDAKAA